VRRETYVGEWLPEPILTDSSEDPARHAEIADSLSVGLLVVLETLTPEQRAVFLLREVFDYDYERIAEVVDKSPAAVRQLAVRARRHVEERKPRFETSREQRDRLAERFFDAVEAGNVGGLEELLAAEATLHGDGGGKAPAIARALQGRSRIAKALGAFVNVGRRFGGFTLRRVEVNGGPGAIVLDTEGRIINVMSLEIGDGAIQSVNSVVNPDKLRHLGEPADVKALFERARQNRAGAQKDSG
jgi:Sigma-70, region 4